MSLQSFLDEIYKSLQSKDGQRIADLIQLDVENLPPQRQQPYVQLNGELNKQYPASKDVSLLQRCQTTVTQEEFGTFSTSFCDSIARYFRYLRDIQTADNLTKALDIRQLTSQCVVALGDSRYGVVMIPIVLSFSRTLAFIATKLDRNPALLRERASSAKPGDTRTSYVEDAANVLQTAFTKCITAGPARTQRPKADEKRSGIYLTANLTLRLFFRCLKQRSARDIFTVIDTASPPLSFYPAPQRVTYLYYLGRYHFANNHFLRASAALHAAYTSCHSQCHSQLRHILTYLLASNLIIGLLPNPSIFQRPHAQPLAPIFLPLITALRTGDIGTFHALLSLPSPLNNNQPPNPIAAFLLRHRIHLQLLNRLEPLVYRSLILKCFQNVGFHGGGDRKVPFLHLYYVRAAARFSFSRAPIPPGTLPHAMPLDKEYYDLESALAETGFDLTTGTYNPDNVITNGEPHPNPFAHDQSVQDAQSPTIAEIESTVLALIAQGFLKGFVLHKGINGPRFAVPGADRMGGWRRAAFPSIFRAVLARSVDGGDAAGEGAGMGLEGVRVPGWVREGDVLGATGGGGRVVKLSGARAVGVAAGS